MALQRGDVVLIPFPYTDLSAAKTRPAVVVSSTVYHRSRSEIILAYVSSQVSKAHPVLDYILVDWASAGLPKPSFVRPKLATVESSLVIHQVGRLSRRDRPEVDRRLRQALALTETVLEDFLAEVDLAKQSAKAVQALAEKSVLAVISLATKKSSDVNVEQLRKLLSLTNQYTTE